MERLNFDALRWIGRVSGRRKWLVCALTGVKAVQGAVALGAAWILKGLVDSAAAGEAASFRLYVLGVALLALMQVLLSALERWLSEYTVTGLECAMKERVLQVLLSRRYELIAAVHSAEWVNRLTGDVSVVASSFCGIFSGLAGMMVRLLGGIVLLWDFAPQYMAVVLPLMLFMLLFGMLFRKRLKALQKRILEADGVYRAYVTEHLERLMVVKAFSAGKTVTQGAGDRMTEHRKRRMERMHFSNLCTTAFYFGTKALYAGAAIYCAFGIFRGSISTGTFAAVTQLVTKLRDPMGSLSGYLPRYYSMIAGAERLMEAESYEEDVPGGEKNPEEIGKLYARMDELRMKDVSFSYPGGQEKERMQALSGFDLTVRKGECVALVGPSGKGKSTVLKLLMGFYAPDEGTLELRLGEETMPLTAAERGLFAYVPQGNQLMSGTIREAVSFGNDSACDKARLRWALETACAWKFVSALENGIDSRLGEQGAGLSEGQLQRLSVARALYSGRPILMLDEATSALDETTEARLIENLRRLPDRTILIVTHRKAALRICSRTVRL